MLSTMQDVPLSIGHIVSYGSRVHASTTVTTFRTIEPETTTFGAIGSRSAAFAHALREELGITDDQRVGTLMFNSAEHLEVMFAVTAMGAVFVPLNKQLLDAQLRHIVRHCNVEVIVVDPRLVDKLTEFIPDASELRTVIITGTDGIPDAIGGVPALSYEALLDGRPTDYAWPELPDNTAAALCYSTGTEGAPKAIAYSHRSLYLQALTLRAADSLGISNGEAFLSCVPIYHVLSWGVPFAAWMSGTPLVLPAADLSAPRLADIIATAQPRKANGVPTLWNQLMVHYLEHPPHRMSLTEVFVGGSPATDWLIRTWEESFGVDIIHVWGMTETTTVGTVARPPAGSSGEQRTAYRVSQGRFDPSLDYRVVNDGDIVTPDQYRPGEIQVRGNLVTASYLPDDADTARATSFTEDGWLRTGDVGTVTSDGFLSISDRARDVIRSGGEWIYSAQLENVIMESDAILECAVVGIPHVKWGERPLAVAVTYPGYPPTADTARAIRAELRAILPNWMIPEYWAFVDHIAKTSVDKFDKKDLRQHLADGLLDVITLPSPGDR
ncbi:long-chain fatty-acid--CoA ligase [Corynebacterium uterequi]|uniref:Acyl-CoA synthetase (AMP-forming)/AMP-acid ligase II n=1 Tax=Corynebacterium uterequi TaxID=1072256 RepID=A0A0G3HIC1_9CORY|nr:long-chain fatty-acid--CoA ligase [Corynebacterium uterequi]AKK10887.1 acyl-CoA synthetase (AMP-forming)/AMP-acid ligase II [Corynebacterium uterequi]